MCLPSSKGLRSTVEMSFVRSAKSSITFRPISECVIYRPRKRMVTLTLSPALKNFTAFFSLV